MMRTSKTAWQLLCLLLAVTWISGCTGKPDFSKEDFTKMQEGFVTPADSNKVWCYWYWLNDDISLTGVTKDLEAMKEVGIGTAFIGNINPNEVNGKVPLFSDDWWNIMVHAVNEGKRLGVDIGVFNCPGWSQSGGPWVTPEMTMRYLTHSRIQVEGGRRIQALLPKPLELFQDVYVLAMPLKNDPVVHPVKINSQPSINGLNSWFDGDITTQNIFTIAGSRELTIELNYDTELTARTLVIHPASNPMKAQGEIQVWNGQGFTHLQRFEYDRSNLSPNVGPDVLGPVVVSLPATKGARYRILFRDISGGANQGGFAEIQVTDQALLDRYIEKQLGKMHPTPLPAWNSYLWDRQEDVPERFVSQVDEVIDLSSRMTPEGQLDWDAPAGKWEIFRFGMTPTGTRNSPAAPQGKGYEIDKASRKIAEYHFNQYVAELLKRIPPESRSALRYVIADSYEMGSQNWTDDYAGKFLKRYGYDPKPFFPALTGRIIGSVEQSNRFLWDLRRAVADDIAYEYVGGLRDVADRNQLTLWLENYGHWGFPGEFLMYGGQSDLVSGEFWNEGELGNIECKAASSAAHIYGKPVTSAEAFTAAGNSYLRHPALLKRRGDWSYTQGINHFVAHVYIHQPDDQRIPGVNAWFSTEFNRHNTWFRQSKAWFDYLRRCQHLLQQGTYAADVCYFIGEDVPKMTGSRDPEIPSGYSYDYINAEVILNRLTVKNGRFVLPDGMSYKLMVLPPVSSMRPEVLAKIAGLVKEGGSILGSGPTHSPSLQDYPECDVKVRSLAGGLWGQSNDIDSIRTVGKGFVFTGCGIQQALDFLKCAPDYISNGENPVLWTHRTKPGMDIYFLTNLGDNTVICEPAFRVVGKRPQLWNAVTGEIRLLSEFRDDGTHTVVPLVFEPGQSWFVVFCNQSGTIDPNGSERNFPEWEEYETSNGPWTVEFLNTDIGPAQPVLLDSLFDLSLSGNDSIRYYSGTLRYTASFQISIDQQVKDFLIDLGQAGVIATVRINDQPAGTLWMNPWKLRIGHLIREGENRIEVEVANLWRNRLIADSKLPKDQQYTWTIISEARPDETPPPSGLLGPVKIRMIK